MYGHPDAVSGGNTLYIVHFFVNLDIFKWPYLAYYWVYLHQTWRFCKAWFVLMTICGSIVANPMIYRLIPSPSQYEIWHYRGVSLSFAFEKTPHIGLSCKLVPVHFIPRMWISPVTFADNLHKLSGCVFWGLLPRICKPSCSLWRTIQATYFYQIQAVLCETELIY